MAGSAAIDFFVRACCPLGHNQLEGGHATFFASQARRYGATATLVCDDHGETAVLVQVVGNGEKNVESQVLPATQPQLRRARIDFAGLEVRHEEVAGDF